MSKLISYAQNFEDVILWRVLGHVEGGRYVDVGAQSPDIDSVSRVFHERGWRGIHVEPTQHYSDLLRARRPDEQVLQVAVSDVPGELRFFDVADTGLSTLDEQIAQEHRDAGFQVSEVRVPAVTLDDVLELAGPGEIHWLKIDVEGAEREVVQGWKGPHRPWVLVIEATRPQSPELSHHEWDPLVLGKGYTFAYFDGLNRFYVSDAHAELAASLTCGPNVFDDFVLAPQSSFCAAANALAAEAEERQHVQLMAAVQNSEALEAQLAAAVQKSEAQDAQLDALKRAESVLQQERDMLLDATRRFREDYQRALELSHGSATEIAQRDTDLARRDAEIARQNAVLHAVLNSRSWRFTRPLRAVRYLLTQPTMFLRRVVLAAMRRVVQRPALARPLNSLLKRVPALHGKLVTVAVNNQIIAQVPVSLQEGVIGGVGSFAGLSEAEGMESLTLRGRAFYMDMTGGHRKESR